MNTAENGHKKHEKTQKEKSSRVLNWFINVFLCFLCFLWPFYSTPSRT